MKKTSYTFGLLMATLCLFCLPVPSALAQYARLKVGLGGGYEYLLGGQWNKAIGALNDAQSFASKQPELRHGWGASFSADYKLKEGFAVGLQLGMSQFKSKGTHPELPTYDPLEMRLKFTSIGLQANVYPLLLFKNSFLPHAQNNFFVQIAPTYYMLKGENQIGAQSLNTSSSGFGGILGFGYHLYLSDRLSLTPMLQLQAATGFKQDSLGASLLGRQVSDAAQYDKSGVLRLGVELKLAYSILLSQPLCPIQGCNVTQPHKHGELGDVVVRGNKYKLRQNQKYGDKHRGDASGTRVKGHKSEKATQKRVKQGWDKRKRKVVY